MAYTLPDLKVKSWEKFESIRFQQGMEEVLKVHTDARIDFKGIDNFTEQNVRERILSNMVAYATNPEIKTGVVGFSVQEGSIFTICSGYDFAWEKESDELYTFYLK